MKKNIQFFVLLALLISTTFSLVSQTLIDSEYKGSLTKEELNDLLGVALFQFGIENYKITYTTLDVQGALDTASGLIVVPVDPSKKYPLACFQHGSSKTKEDVPSNLSDTYEIALAYGGMGYVVFAPDLLGLGEARGFHPYIHAASAAWASIDMLHATKTFLAANDILINEQLFITGYSQGGYSAMAMHRELEANYSTEFPVVASTPMGAPYSISGIMKDFLFSGSAYEFPGYLVHVILSYQTVYGNLFTELEDYFKPAYVDIIDSFYHSEISLDSLHNYLNNQIVSEIGEPIPIHILKEEVVDSVLNHPGFPLNVAMLDNDVYDWAPQAPMRIFYCEADEQASFENALLADSVMNENGAVDVLSYDVGSTLSHNECGEPAVIASIFFFGTYQRIDEVSAVFEPLDDTRFSFYPNPASDVLFVKNEYERSELELIDMTGKILLYKTLDLGENQISLAHLPGGIYFFKVKIEGQFFSKKVMVQRI